MFIDAAEKVDNEEYPLTNMQKRQLELVKSFFPNFEAQGLGRTSLITHKIDVGSVKPVKQ